MCYARVQNFTKTADKFVTCNQVRFCKTETFVNWHPSGIHSCIYFANICLYMEEKERTGASCPAISPYMTLVLKRVLLGSIPIIFLLRITTTSNKCEMLNNLNLKVGRI